MCGKNADFHPQEHPLFTYLKSAHPQIRILSPASTSLRLISDISDK